MYEEDPDRTQLINAMKLIGWVSSGGWAFSGTEGVKPGYLFTPPKWHGDNDLVYETRVMIRAANVVVSASSTVHVAVTFRDMLENIELLNDGALLRGWVHERLKRGT